MPAHILAVPAKSSETRAILLLISDNREYVRVRYTEDRPRIPSYLLIPFRSEAAYVKRSKRTKIADVQGA
jgi:hypothetical protein